MSDAEEYSPSHLASPKKNNYRDLIYQDAILQSLEVLGEAAEKISDEFQEQHPELPLRQIKDLRNVLIHQYSCIDL